MIKQRQQETEVRCSIFKLIPDRLDKHEGHQVHDNDKKRMIALSLVLRVKLTRVGLLAWHMTFMTLRGQQHLTQAMCVQHLLPGRESSSRDVQ